jgi:tRNA 5-methylaminomethyl-2-thiouridine biosynthesis bifunctional protein
VIGAGLAGAAIADGFARRGFAIDLLDANPQPGGRGSAQPLVAEHLHLSPDDNPIARLSRAALLLRAAREQGATGMTPSAMRGASAAHVRGRLAVDSNDAEGERQAEMLSRLGFPPAFVRRLARDEAADAAGIALPRGGLWLPECAAVAPGDSIREWLSSAGEAVRFRGETTVARLEADPAGAGWIAVDASGQALAAAPVVVVANAGDAARLGAQACLSMRRVRGQTTWLRDPAVAPLRVVLGGDAYAAPSGAGDGRVLIGASFDDGDSLLPDPRDDLGNLRRLGRMLDRDPRTMRAGAASAAAGFRFTLPDRLPAIGPLPDEAAASAAQADLRRNDRLPIPMAPGLYCAAGFGSRGLLWAVLAAELLPAMVCGEPAPLERELIAAVAPARFLRRRLRAAPR